MDYWPDGDQLGPGVLLEVTDFAPNNNRAYKRIHAAETFGYSALTTTPCLGSAMLRDSSGTAYWLAGSSTKLYKASGAGGWTDISNGATFGATAWDFAAFGNNLIAADGNGQLKVSALGAAVTTITDSPTGASIVYVHKNALIALGNSTNSAGWARSKTADYTTWTAAANNDADSGTLYGGIGGKITAGTAFGNLALAWKKAAMYGGVYVGNSDPDLDVIKWEIISDNPSHGCVGKWAHIKTPVGVFYASSTDVLLFAGSAPVSVMDKVRKRWLTDAYTNNGSMFLTHDAENNHVYVWIRPSGQTNCTQAFVYNYRTDQWGRLDTVNGISGAGVKVPIRGANVDDIGSLAGTITLRQANAFFDDTVHTPWNISSTTLTSDGSLRSGLKGDMKTEAVLQRVYLLSDTLTQFGTGITVAATAYGIGKQSSKTTQALPVTNGAWADIGLRGHLFEATFTSPSTGGLNSLERMQFEIEPAETRPPVTLVE